jgi:cyclophilin family peptidyl-prolyl cis-trans isomerase
MATGMGLEDYRDLARELLLPAEQDATRPSVIIETGRGNIIIELFAQDAPLATQSFLDLADRRFFDGHRWHRVVPAFVIQDGDPRGDGTGGPGYTLRDEVNRRSYERGTVGMARSGPDTGGSQFFITLSPQPHLEGAYTVFGQVVSGLDVMDRITQGDRVRRLRRW